MSIKKIILGKLESWMLELVVEDEIHGIKICNLRSTEDGFVEVIKSSIELIRQIDPRRYNRVKKEIDWLVNSNMHERCSGNYKRSSKSCFIGFNDFSEDAGHVSAYFAGLIVHESTHGVLHTKGLGSDKTRRVQVERICTAEENRFYSKIEYLYPEYEGTLVHDFDPSNWEGYWNTPKYKRFIQEIRRIIDDLFS